MKTYNLVYENESSLSWIKKELNLNKSWNILIQVFCGIIDEEYIKIIQKVLSVNFPWAKIIWATTAWEIIWDRVVEGKIVLSISVFEYTLIDTCIYEISAGSEEKFWTLIWNNLIKSNTKALILFSDSIWINVQDLLKWVSNINKNVVIAWWSAWDNYLFTKSYVFDNNIIVSNWAVAASFNSDVLNVNVDYNFDWITVWKFLEVTKSQWNKLYEIDNIPIKHIIKEYLWSKIYNNLPFSGIEFPIVIDKDWVKIARTIMQNNSDGSISLAWNINVWDKIQFGYGHKAEILNSSYKIFNRLKLNPIESLFIYSCCARRKYLWQDIEKEINNLKDLWAVSWFFTYWEFFHTNSWVELMNETMTILSFSESDKKLDIKDKKREYDWKIYDSTVYALTHLIKKTSEELIDLNDFLKQRIDENIKDMKDQEAIYRAIVEDQTELICRYSYDGVYSFVNKAFCRYFRKEYNEIVWHKFSMDIPDEDLLIVNKKLFSLNVSSPSHTIEHRIIVDWWEIRWLQWTDHAIFNENWEVIEYQSIWRDITEKKLIQEKYEKSKDEYFALYKTIIDNMDEIVWIWDRNKNTIYANTKYCQITWYKLSEIKWKNIFNLWDEKIVQKLKKINAEFWNNEKHQWEWALISKSWKIISVFKNKVPFLDGWTVLVMQDLTDIKKLKKRADHLKELNSLKSEFVSIASHELRTPMTSIKGYLSMILDGDYWYVNDSVKDTLWLIYKNTQRLIDLINDMLDLSKLDAWKVTFNKEFFWFKSFVQEIYDEYVNYAKDKKLNFVLEWDEEDLVLNTDRDKLRQIMLNLISNAFKFTPNWGKIILRWGLDKKDSELLLCEVVDTWIWIDKKDFKKVFGNFQQVNSHLIRQQAWTWLWIPISQKLLKKMWWNLYLESKLWKGSKFYFTIPLNLK